MNQGERLKFVIERVAHGNQAEFARATSTPTSSISKLIKSEYIITPRYVAKFVAAYPSINGDYLLGLSDNPGTFMTMDELKKEVEELREENKRLKAVIDKLLEHQ